MNALYSWLQEEVNCQDLNEFLYEKNLGKIKDKVKAKQDIDGVVKTLLEANLDYEKLIEQNGYNISIQPLLNPKTHALFNPNTQEICISSNWLQYLESKLDKQTAYRFCLSHEICHLIESDSWFQSYNRRERRTLLEVVALKYSQCVMSLNYHPNIFEYGYGLKHEFYTKEDLVNYLKGN